jgi:hypothetical protein
MSLPKPGQPATKAAVILDSENRYKRHPGRNLLRVGDHRINDLLPGPFSTWQILAHAVNNHQLITQDPAQAQVTSGAAHA